MRHSSGSLVPSLRSGCELDSSGSLVPSLRSGCELDWLLLAAVATVAACGGSAPSAHAPAVASSSASASASALASASASASPLASASPPLLPGHVNQITASGDFTPPTTPPPPAAEPPVPAMILPPFSALHGGPPISIKTDSEHPCGIDQRDGEDVLLECQDPQTTRVRGAFKPMLSHTDLQGEGVKAFALLPAAVDHRTKGAEGPIRNQGRVGACSAFSLAAAMDHAMFRWSGHAGAVDVMQLWARYHSGFADQAIRANTGKHLAAEASWPYDVVLADAITVDDPHSEECTWIKARSKLKCPATADPDKMALAESNPVAELGEVDEIDPTDFDGWRAVIASGQDIWILLRSAGIGQVVQLDGNSYVKDYDAQHVGPGHFLVVAGYRVGRDGTYFLLHNSWGPSFGDGGYGWIHSRTLQKNMDLAYIVDAYPSNEPSARPKRQSGHTVCPDGVEPDSITLQCVPPCSDGSPRQNGVCAVEGHCATGKVNLSGECVPAAPRRHGESNGVAFSCGPGGCFYRIEQAGGCHEALCEVSCPAPTYRLTKGDTDFGCME